MDWEGCGKKHLWPISRYCSCICVEGLKIANERKSSVKIAGVMAKI
jgi:hypothetical protein